MTSLIWLVALSVHINGIRTVFGEEHSQWPKGPYALPMSVYGCPETRARGWSTGYLNLAVESPVFDPPPDNDRVTRHRMTLAEARMLPILGPYGEYTVQLNFCYKIAAHHSSSEVWPYGNYVIYGTSEGCPLGFNATVKIVRLGKLRSWTADGDVPEIRLRKHPAMTELTVTVCEHNDQDHTAWATFTDDVDSHFVLFKINSHPCPVVNSVLNTTEVELSFLHDPTNTTGVFAEKWICCSYNVPESSPFLRVLPDMGRAAYGGFWPAIGHISKGSDQVPWMLLDLVHSQIVKLIYINFVEVYGDDDDMSSVDGWPSVHVSQHKWSFLTHGSPQCLQLIYHYTNSYAIGNLDLLCRNELEGRYVAVVGNRYDPADPRHERHFLHFFRMQIKLLGDEGRPKNMHTVFHNMSSIARKPTM